MGDLASVMAQHNAMARRCVFLPHGSCLYEIETGWEAFSLQFGRHPVVCVTTRGEFERALKDPDGGPIFIPLSSSLPLEEIEKLCQRYAIVKTIYREVGAEQKP